MMFCVACAQNASEPRFQNLQARQQAFGERQAAFQREHSERRRAFFARVEALRAKIMNSDLPPDEKAAELNNLQRLLDDVERSERESAREQREQEMIDAQQDLANAIRDLSDQLGESRY